jgi:predicted metalloendopeptidase
VGADDKTALKTHLVRVGGLGLPDQDYYISEDKTLKKKEICTKHIARMLQFIGDSCSS